MWGYTRAANAADFADRYRRLVETVRDLAVLSGFCYTQFADTYQETNGLLYADRRPKIPIEEIARATAGPPGGRPFDPVIGLEPWNPKPLPGSDEAG